MSDDDTVAADGGSTDVGREAATGPGSNSAGSSDPGRAGYRHLARAVLYREYLIFVRYPANAFGAIIISIFFFAVLFFGGRMVAGQALTDSIEGIIVGYFLWTLSVGAYSSISNDIGSEVQWGTLERHVTTPFGFAPVALLKGVAKVVRTFLLSLLILGAMLLLTGEDLSLHLPTIVVIAGLTISSVLGLGFAAGGVTVLYKRIGNWLNLLQFGFVVLVSAPALEISWLSVLPLAHGSGMLQQAMVDGVRLWEFSPLDLGLLLAVAVGYLAVGYGIFQVTTSRARELGVLGDY